MKLFTNKITKDELYALGDAMGIEVGQGFGSIEDDGVRVKGKYEGKHCYRFVLRPARERGELRNDYRKNSGYHSNGVYAVSWAGHYVFMRAVFELDPEATIKSAVSEWRNRNDFAGRAYASQDRNVGSMMYPVAYGDAQVTDHVDWYDEADLISLAHAALERSGIWEEGHWWHVDPPKPERVVVKPGEVITMKQTVIANCPNFIFLPDHYNTDGSCRCYEPDANEMIEYGYKWHENSGVWG